MERPEVSIIIPTLNEEKNIGKVIDGIRGSLKGYSYEIIVVDGNSKDRTAEIARSKKCKVIFENVGKGYAIRKGMRHAKGNIIVSMDADLSNEPKELRLLIESIRIGYDIAMGSRFITGGGSYDMPLYRKFGNKLFVLLVNLIYKCSYTDMCYGYRAFSRKAIRKMKLKENGFGIETEISIEAKKRGLRVIEIPSVEKIRA
ncbi:MAG: glycosyltransferase family 2 protein, partial [Candidatus Micrarchaeaceae archaeon]